MSQRAENYTIAAGYHRPNLRIDFDIAIVCALPVEYDAVCLLVDEHWGRFGRAQGDSNTYTTGRIGNHHVVILLLASIGKSSAATAVANLRMSFTAIRLALLVGICGATPSSPRGEILLGDVIIGDEVKPYDYGKRYPNEFRRTQSFGYNSSNFNRDIRGLLNVLTTDQGMRQFEERTCHYLQRLQEAASATGSPAKYVYPGAAEDKLFESTYRHKHYGPVQCICLHCCADTDPVCDKALNTPCLETKCDNSRTIARRRLIAKKEAELHRKIETQHPNIHFGQVGSADTVLKSANDRDRLSDELKVIGFEMESAGFFNELPGIVIKGACDYADSHKSKRWQPFAAATAASACKALLERYERAHPAPEEFVKGSKRGRVDHAHPAIYSIPLPKNECFVGREGTLRQLREMLLHKQNFRCAALVGLGGAGKTQVALQLAYMMKDEFYDEDGRECSVLWIPALSIATFEQACADIARRIPQFRRGEADPKQHVKDYFSTETAGRWLLVLDNADDYELIFGSQEKPGGLLTFLPQSDLGCIFVTTRDRRVAVGFANTNVVSLPVMETEEAVAFLKKSLIEKHLLDAKEAVLSLLELLDKIPLAIAQAAAYINSNQITIFDYVNLLQGISQDKIDILSRHFEDSTRYSGSQNAIARTWLTSFDQITRKDPKAAGLLLFISCIEPKGIPASLLPAEESQEQLIHSLGTLLSYEFLTKREEAMYDMHSLVHIAIKEWQKVGSAEALDLVIRQVALVFPDGDYENREIWRAYLPHALKILKENIVFENNNSQALGIRVGKCLRFDGRIREAVSVLEPVVAIRERTLSEEHPDRLASQHNLALAYESNRETGKAISLLEHVVAIGERTLSEEHPDRLTSQQNLALAYEANRETGKAISLLEHVVAIREGTLSEEHPDRLTSQHNLALAYEANGETGKAISLLEHVVAIREGTLSEEHPDRLASQHNLATVYRANGETGKAISLLEHIVAIGERTLSEEHPDRLTSQQNLALVYEANRETGKAISLLEHVVAIREGTLSEEHPDRLTSQYNLALVYKANGETGKAISLLEHVVAIKEGTLSEEHPDQLTSQHNLALAYKANGETGKAISLLEHIVAIGERILSEEHPDRLTSQQNLALAYKTNGETGKAISLLEHVVAIGERILSKEHPSLLASQHNLALAYEANGETGKAILLLEHVVAIEERVLHEEHPGRLASQRALTMLYKAYGRPER